MSTKLLDLSPRWIADGDNPRAALVFKCPCCPGRKTYLAVKLDESLTFERQCDLFADAMEAKGQMVGFIERLNVIEPGYDQFANLSLRGEINATGVARGHWRGFIYRGEITR